MPNSLLQLDMPPSVCYDRACISESRTKIVENPKQQIPYKHLELTAEYSSTFFHVTQALEEDETFEIRMDTLSVGIRGTYGWVQRTAGSACVYILDGDRIEVERAFSLSKRCYGMGLIMTKLDETQLATIALSVFVTNLFKIQRRIHAGKSCSTFLYCRPPGFTVVSS